jgi:hypothetical protein
MALEKSGLCKILRYGKPIKGDRLENNIKTIIGNGLK